MIRNLSFTLIVAMSTVILQAQEPLTFRQKLIFNQQVILESMYKAKAWQEAQHEGPVPTNWLTGTLYTGVFACYEATGKIEFLDAARDWCIAADWTCGETRPMHADGICSAQTFLDVYSQDKDPSQIANIKELIDEYYFGVEEIPYKLIGHAIWKEDSRPFTGRNLWWWCDALYMAPPVFARLGAHTGEQKYFDLMHELYWDCKDFLYDPEEHLFFRDEAYFDALTPNGKKKFWSRGNGWVVAGLVRTLDYLTDEDPMKEKYLELYREMMLRLAGLQHDGDGTWSSSVNDPEWLPDPESSASSFYTFAMAAGINRGWLDPKIYLPHVVKGWEGLLSCLREDGKLEWAQMVDEKARQGRHEDHKNYAQGAFLLAAAEVYKMNLSPEKYVSIVGKRRVVTIAREGAWTWYNDERVVFWNEHLVAGMVNNSGQSTIGIYLKPGGGSAHRLEMFPLSSWTEKDDHNNPALLPLGKDSLLVAYAKHGTSKEFNTRYIGRNFKLSPERSVKHGAGLTYSNLYQLENEEGKIYNFFRGEGWNPNLVTSTDQGLSWSESTMIFLSGSNSTRPYVKYASDNKGRIDLFYTDGHPRRETENNVYHAFYEDGAMHNSRGKKIRSMEAIKDKPLLPGDGTLIYDGSGPGGRGWVHDFERGKDGALAGAFISSPDGDEGLDLRYHYARFDPKKKKWNVHDLGKAGPHLYVPENHYAGGICIDPYDVNVVWLSSSLDPATGEVNGTGHYQIYRGITEDEGMSWSFERITHDVNKDNLRPVVPRNRPVDMDECVVWFRGRYDTYTDFETELVGIVPAKEKK
jgi:rhamnogalacturonyl hydrolase YesR